MGRFPADSYEKQRERIKECCYLNLKEWDCACSFGCSSCYVSYVCSVCSASFGGILANVINFRKSKDFKLHSDLDGVSIRKLGFIPESEVTND